MKTFRRLFPVMLLALAVPAARAQDSHAVAGRAVAPAAVAPAFTPAAVAPTVAPELTAPTVVPATAGPTVARATVGVRAATPAPARTPAAPKFAETNQNRALMIVGGAALIVGAIIGDTPGTLVMVGGAVVGLYGLYKYLE